MNLNPDDPRITAYALGEMDEPERRAFEDEIRDDPEAQRAVEEIRKVAQTLTEELKTEKSPGLLPVQRAAIDAVASQRKGIALRGATVKPLRYWWVGFAAAACLLLAVTALMIPALGRAQCRAPGMLANAAKQQMKMRAEAYDKMSPPEAAPAVRPNYTQLSERPVAGTERAQLSESLPAVDMTVVEKEQFGPSMPDYSHIVENPFQAVADHPLSTFSIDVDTASYSIVRRFLNDGQLPPKDAVRIEEMINYFSYDYAPPKDETPFAVHLEVAGCPWNREHRLARIALRGRDIVEEQRPSTSLVFLLDVSGSMQPSNKLPLLRRAMKVLAERLTEKDRVAIVVYAGASGLILPSTPCTSDGQGSVLAAIDRLEAGGSTNGGAGIELAYRLATENFIRNGVNRVILATDGDFNVGVTNRGDLIRLVEEKAKTGVFLTVLGFGMGNLKDATLEQLADKGNGNYAYIDTFEEARKVFVEQMSGTLVTIAKDVKIQIEFNPALVSAYRLVGYENRLLAKEDFNDDKKDAGEIGAGHTVTAFYELVPAGKKVDLPGVDPLKYQGNTGLTQAAGSGELMTVKLRYKQPDGDTSKLLEFAARDSGARYGEASGDFQFAASVATFGMILRDSKYKGGATYDTVLELAEEGLGRDVHGYRAEFLRLVKAAKAIRER